MGDQLRLPDESFDTLQESIESYSVTKKTQLGIPPAPLLELSSNKVSWEGYWALSKNKKTASQVDNENTRAMKSKYIDFLRTFVKQYYYDNPAATDADILSAGLIPHSATRPRTIPPSGIMPSVTAEPKAAHTMLFKCLNPGGNVAKPRKIVFIRVKWFVGVDVPAEPEMFTRFKDFSKHPVQITFNTADAGKPMAYAVCYVANDGTEAPFTTIVHTMVP